MNIYIPIEVKIRELESKVLLALAAAEKGFNVVIGSKDEVLQPVVEGKVEPGIVHMKSVTPSDAMLEMLQKLKKNGSIVTALDEEAGIIDEDFTPFGRLRFSNDSLNLADAMFCWGQFDRNALQAMFPKNAGKFIATGSPRVDLWKPEFNEFHLSKESGLTEKYGTFVLLSSNFGTILNENRIPNMIARMREAGYFDRDPQRENHEFQNAAFQTQLIWEFVKLFRHLSSEFPDINFVIRPHPVESIESWKMLIGEYPNIHVLRQGSITPWVLNSVCVLHNGCTTGLEAAFFGKEVIAFRPIPSPIERVVPNNVSFQAFNVEDVVARLREVLNNTTNAAGTDPEIKSLLKSRFENYGTGYGFDGIVDNWTTLSMTFNSGSSSTDNKTGSDPTITASGPTGPTQLRRVLSKIKNSLFSTDVPEYEVPKQLLNTSHKFETLTDSEVEMMVNSFTKATNRFKGVEMQRIGEKSFRFYSNDKTDQS